MAATAISNLVIPELWEPYAQSMFPKYSTLQMSGLVTIDSELLGAGQTSNKPVAKSLNAVGAEQVLTANTDLTVRNTTAYNQIGYIVRRGNALGVEDQAQIVSGVQFAQTYVPQLSTKYARETDATLIASIGGWDTALQAEGSFTYTTGDGTSSITANLCIDTISSLGEASSDADVWIMHTQTLGDLTKLGLVAQQPAMVFADGIIREGLVPSYLGRRIVTNDTLCGVVDAGPPIERYVYLIAGGAFQMRFQKPLTIRGERDELKAGGTDYIVWTSHYQWALGGLSWTEATNTNNPTNADITSGAWTVVAETPSDIPMRRLHIADA